MPDRPHHPRALLPFAVLDWEGDAPRDRVSGDVFFSDEGLSESRHVFLGGNDLAVRFDRATLFTIGEIGFGAGLNMLAAWALWRAAPRAAAARLHLFSVERTPFALMDLERAHAAWPSLAPFAARLRALLPPPVPGTHRLALDRDVALTLVLGEAARALATAEARVDAWFLDGFAPAKNPDAWTPDLFAELARLSAPDATSATFTVAGVVRRGLEEAGFAVEKRAGYGRKREMLAGRLVRPDARRVRAPWFDPSTKSPVASQRRPFRVAVVGGGVAGASVADAARAAGLAPTIFDPAGLAAGASGNAAGLVMPRLDLGDTPAARFFLEAFLHAERRLSALGDVFTPTGILLGAVDADGRDRLRRLADAALLPPGHLRAEGDGLLLGRAGVVDPAAFVAALAGDAPLVRERVGRLGRADGGVTLHTDESAHGPFDAVVLAAGVDTLRFVEARGLPLTAVAGQIDWFPEAAAPARAHAAGAYAAPAPRGGLVIGATYDRAAAGALASLSATERNLDAVRAFAPDLVRALDAASSRPRAAFRCQTPDRLPVAGPLPDVGFYGGEYDGLRTGLVRDYPRAERLPGVYVLAGLGSRGLVTAPLLAEMIVSEMVGAPSPVAADIAEAVHPARFFIRSLKRGPAG